MLTHKLELERFFQCSLGTWEFNDFIPQNGLGNIIHAF